MRNRILGLVILSIAASSIIGCKHDGMKTDATSVDELLARWAPQPVEFSGTTYTSPKGMMVTLGGPFYSLATGAVVNGIPASTITVYHDPKEMLLGGLQTVSFGAMLGTSGSFKLKTTINGEAVRANTMEVRFPAIAPQQPMELFTGSLDTGAYNWTRMDSSGYDGIDYMYIPGSEQYIYGFYSGLFMPDNPDLFSDGTLMINCDFYCDVPSITDVWVSVDQLASGNTVLSATTKLYFPVHQALYSGRLMVPERYWNVPIGYASKAIAIVIDSEQNLYYGVADITIESGGQYLIHLEEVTEEELRAALMAI